MAWTNKTEDFPGDASAHRDFLRESEKTGKGGHATISFAPGERARVFSTSDVVEGAPAQEEIQCTSLQEFAEQLRHLQVEREALIAGTDVRAVEKIAELDHKHNRLIQNGLSVSEESLKEMRDLIGTVQDEKVRTVLEEYVDGRDVDAIRAYFVNGTERDASVSAPKTPPVKGKKATHDVPSGNPQKSQFGRRGKKEQAQDTEGVNDEEKPAQDKNGEEDTQQPKPPELVSVAPPENKEETDARGVGEEGKPTSDTKEIGEKIQPTPPETAPVARPESEKGPEVLSRVAYNPDFEKYIEALAKEADLRGDIDITPQGGVKKSGTQMASVLRNKLGVLRNKVEEEDSVRGIGVLNSDAVERMRAGLERIVKNMPLSEEVKANIVESCIATAQFREQERVPRKPKVESTTKPVASPVQEGEPDTTKASVVEMPPEKVSAETRERLGREVREVVKDVRAHLGAMNQFLVDYIESMGEQRSIGGFFAKLLDKKPDERVALEREGNALLAKADAFVRESEMRMKTMREEVAGMADEADARTYALLVALLEDMRGRTYDLITRVLEAHREAKDTSDSDRAFGLAVGHGERNPVSLEKVQSPDIEGAQSIPVPVMEAFGGSVKPEELASDVHELQSDAHQEADERVVGKVTHVPIATEGEHDHTLSETRDLVEALLAEEGVQGEVPELPRASERNSEEPHGESKGEEGALSRDDAPIAVGEVDRDQSLVSTEKKDTAGESAIEGELLPPDDSDKEDSPALAGKEGVEKIVSEYLRVVGDKKGWEGIGALLAYLETQDTVPSKSNGVITKEQVLRTIRALTKAMPTEADGTVRVKKVIEVGGVEFERLSAYLPSGGLREIVCQLIEQAVQDSLTQKEGPASVAKGDKTQESQEATEENKANTSQQEVPQEPNEKNSPPKYIDETVYREFSESFNIDEKTLEAIPGFAEMNTDRQRLVIHTLRKYALLEVRTESERGYEKEVKESSGFMKKMWLGLTKAHRLVKRKREVTDAIFKRDFDETKKEEQLKTIASLTEMAAQVRGVKETEGGEFELSFVGESDFTPKNKEGEPRPLTPEERRVIERYNQAVREFGSLPSTLNMEVSWERNMYDEAKAEYTKAREELLALKDACEGGDEEGKTRALLFGNTLDRDVMLSQFLKSCPEVESALLRIKDESVMKQTIIDMLKTRGGYMVLGGGVRWATTATLASAGAGLAGLVGLLAAPLAAGAVVGGVRGRLDARGKIARSEERIRTGGAWETLEKDGTNEERIRTNDEWETPENGGASGVQKSTALVEKLDALVARVEQESDEEKRKKLLVLLRDRISYTQRRSVSDEVDFGVAGQQAAARLDLLQAMAHAQVVEGLAETTGRMQENFEGKLVYVDQATKKEYHGTAMERDTVSLDERVSRILGMRREMAKTKQEEYVYERTKEGVKKGAAYALVGALIVDATRGLMASEDVPRVPEDVQNAGATKGVDMAEKGTELPKIAVEETESPVASEKSAAVDEGVKKVEVVPESDSALLDVEPEVTKEVVPVVSDHAHTEPTPPAEVKVEPPVTPDAPVRVTPPSEDGSLIRVNGEVPAPAEVQVPSAPDAPPAEAPALESKVPTPSEIAMTSPEQGLAGETLTLSHTYAKGESVERVLQQMLKTDEAVKAYQPNLTKEDIGSIASRIRMELQNDPKMAGAFGVQDGNWNRVAEGAKVEVPIPTNVIRDAIDRFHPPSPEPSVGEVVPPPVPVAEVVPTVEATPTPVEVASPQEEEEVYRELTEKITAVDEKVETLTEAEARIAEMIERNRAQMEALQKRLEEIANPTQPVTASSEAPPVREVETTPTKPDSPKESPIFSGISARLDHFTPEHVGPAVGQIEDLLRLLENKPSIDAGALEAVRGLLGEKGLLVGYPPEHIATLRDMPEVWGTITLKDLFDETRGLAVRLDGGKEVLLSDKTETMFLDMIYRMRIRGGTGVDAIITRLKKEGGTMLDLITQVSRLIPYYTKV